ncbi:Zinc metalloproteinase nas-6 [Trichinella pseudospiralis]|uniref:Metalloendopeptidase n=1 Tax=Trichinella pseudospiralis TaxID=6337 RepID=A0A0V1JQ50_TRIPS|nr:Zinc metalloproteinase nas-6 [Trichinella pseudospiralis]
MNSKFEGDIDGVSFEDFNPMGIMPRSSVRDKHLLWKDGIVPYEISAIFTTVQRKKVTNAMKMIEANSCVRFVPRTIEPDYLVINNDQGCFSMVGRMQGRQVVSLGSGCLFNEVIVHELMHVLGFWHEQSRTDRDDFIIIRAENVIPSMVGQFRKIELPYVDFLDEKYDYYSIMHYDSKAFSRNGENTIEAVEPKMTEVIGKALELSASDIRKLNKLYECTTVNAVVTDPPPESTTVFSRSTTPTLPTSIAKPEWPTQCQDRFDDCDTFARYCRRFAFRHVMKKHCPKTCEFRVCNLLRPIYQVDVEAYSLTVYRMGLCWTKFRPFNSSNQQCKKLTIVGVDCPNDNSTSSYTPVGKKQLPIFRDCRKIDTLEKYRFANLCGVEKIKENCAIAGEQFTIDNCQDCTLCIFDRTAAVTVDDCIKCNILIGPCAGSIFIRNCKSCQFWIICQQLRTRDCHDLQLNVFCQTKPTIEASTNIQFSCIQIHYDGLDKQMTAARLNPLNNYWNVVHDFSADESPVANYTLLYEEKAVQLQSESVFQNSSVTFERSKSTVLSTGNLLSENVDQVAILFCQVDNDKTVDDPKEPLLMILDIYRQLNVSFVKTVQTPVDAATMRHFVNPRWKGGSKSKAVMAIFIWNCTDSEQNLFNKVISSNNWVGKVNLKVGSDAMAVIDEVYKIIDSNRFFLRADSFLHCPQKENSGYLV